MKKALLDTNRITSNVKKPTPSTYAVRTTQQLCCIKIADYKIKHCVAYLQRNLSFNYELSHQ